MQLIRQVKPIHIAYQPSVVTIGNFDGVHLGHQRILQRLQTLATEHQAKSTVILFEPQPLEFFRQETAPARLTRFKEKLILLNDYGVERVLCLRFNAKLAAMQADRFVTNILVDLLQTKHIIIGDDFHFGHNREGDYTFLTRCGQRFNFVVSNAGEICQDNKRISSSSIRTHLAAGELDRAKALLGRDYMMMGRVINGQGLARQWGVPTANIRVKRQVMAMQGAYIVKARVLPGANRLRDLSFYPYDLTDTIWLPAVASLGTRPSIESQGEALLEVHLLDKNIDLYGKTLQVVFLKKCHDEITFASVDKLKQQIEADVAMARAFFQHSKVPRL